METVLNRPTEPSDGSSTQTRLEVFKEAILQSFKPSLEEFEGRFQTIAESQLGLQLELERLQAELSILSSNVKLPPALVETVQLVKKSQKRVQQVNTTLVNVLDRFERIEAHLQRKSRSE